MAKTATTAPAEAGEKKRGNLLPRLSVPLTADKSRFAVESMTDPVRERLRAVLADPELRAKLNLPDDRPPAAAGDTAAAAAAASWDASVTGILWDAAGRLLVMAAARQGFTPAEASILLFSEDEKTTLAPATIAVLEKYLPGGLARYGPEVVLAGAVLGILQAKLFTLRRLAAERAPREPAAAPATVHPFPAPAPPGAAS